MELIENIGSIASRFSNWRANESFENYPWVENVHSPFTPMRRALPMMNLGLISSAGAYIDGTPGFDLESKDGDVSFKEIPIEVEAEDIRYSAKGYDPTHVVEDRNCQIPIDGLLGYEANSVIGNLNNVWWSISSHIPNAALVARELAPRIADRLQEQKVNAALLIPATKLCHQTLGIIAREIEQRGIPTMMIAVERKVAEMVRAPRIAYYKGDVGCVVGKPGWKEYQMRVLDEAIRWIETFDQPASRKLSVELETITELARGER
jgi:D-proline reductase (dithiol) PrdB